MIMRMGCLTYNVPRVSQVWMGLHEKAHCDDFKHHFNAENDQEDFVEDLNNRVWLIQAWILNGQADAVSKNGEQDEPVKPNVEYNLHDEAAEPTRARTPA